MNVISKYLFLEHFCQFSEGIPKFLSEAGDSIHSFSSCTHIGALKTECKCKSRRMEGQIPPENQVENVSGDIISSEHICCVCGDAATGYR